MKKHSIHSVLSETKHIQDSTTVTKGVRCYNFSIPVSAKGDLTNSKVMELCGYSPAGYGMPYNESIKDGVVTFTCAGSCD